MRSKISDRLPTTRGIINSCLLLGEMAVKAVGGVVDEGDMVVTRECEVDGGD